MKFNATSIQQHQAARLLTNDYRLTRENILGDGLKLCRRAKAHNSSNPKTAYIAVQQHQDGYIAKMHDVAHCGNAHLCAFCAGVKAAHMRDWVSQVFLPEIKKRGLVAALLTLTAHHERESDWSVFVKKLYGALEALGKTMQRDLKAIGSIGRVRGMESPVGSNGLHIHIHDLLTYKPGADIEALRKVILAKWKAALRKFGLHCSKRGVDIKADGSFDPRYVAKEVAAHGTKNESKSDLETLFQLLDKSARGNKQAGRDWIRAARAIQGRDRWNVGRLAIKLGIPCPSDWKKSDVVSTADPAPLQLIEYPQSHHMIATSPNNERAGLAFILRSARNEPLRPGSVLRMVSRMCEETIKADIELIKQKHAHKLANSLHGSMTADERNKLAGKQFAHCTFAIAEYRATTYSYMYPAQPSAAPMPTALTPTMAPNLELDFA